MKHLILIAACAGSLLAVGAAAQTQPPSAQSGTPMPMGQMMQGQPMAGGRMQQGPGMPGSMMGGSGGGMMGRFSPEDMSAFIDAHIAAIHAGLRLSTEQEKLWPPVEDAIRNLSALHVTHMQAMREARTMQVTDPIGLVRTMADRMGQGAEALRRLADAAAPLYATLDGAQKRRLQVLVRMGGRGIMGRGMMGPSGAMMPDDDDDGDAQDKR